MPDPTYSFNDHYEAALDLMDRTSADSDDTARWVAMAQVHATLAVAMATQDLNLAVRSRD